MRRDGRKEITMGRFYGVSADGGLVFNASVFLFKKGWNRTEIAFKITSYATGIMEIAVDWREKISDIAGLVSGMFSEKGNFKNVDSVIVKYRNIRLCVNGNTGKKNIVCMLMKAISVADCKNGDNKISVDTQICQVRYPLRASDTTNMFLKTCTNYFRFDEILKYGKSMWFRNPITEEVIAISSIKDGIVTVESIASDLICDFATKIKKFFHPYSNFYGIKAVEIEINEFQISVDEQNMDRILYLYQRSGDMSSALFDRKLYEYYNSKEYAVNHARSLKKMTRKKAVLQKIRQYKKDGVDFTIVGKNKQEEWENYKVINSKSYYNNCVINYTILWAQCMEYLMNRHGKKLSDIWYISSRLADVYGVTIFMYGCAVNILSSLWKYGEELKMQHNSMYNYEGSGVVNPAIVKVLA